MPDKSNGYESVARDYIAGRGAGGIVGVSTVRDWAAELPRGASVLDLGCGNGVPISQVLVNAGLAVYGVDASPTMVAAFRAGFPRLPVECCAAEDSRFFDRSFDAVIAWGLMFLLTPETQSLVVRKVAKALNPGGRFLFTSCKDAVEWTDCMTGLKSVSLGAQAYHRILLAEGFSCEGERSDEGDNHYYLARKT